MNKLRKWYYCSILPVYRTCCSCITVKRRRKCDMIQCFNTLLDIIKKPIHGYIYQFIWHKKQQHQNSCEENNANTTASLVRSGFFFLCEILQPYSHVLKYILSDTRAESVSSLILDRTLVQKPPPTEKARSDSTEVGFTVNKLWYRISRFSVRLPVASNILKSLVTGHLNLPLDTRLRTVSSSSHLDTRTHRRLMDVHTLEFGPNMCK